MYMYVLGKQYGPDQTASTEAVWSGTTLFVKKPPKTLQQTTKAGDFCCDWRFKGEVWSVAPAERMSP